MAKAKKKRNKSYAGVDAKVIRPSVTRMTAENRNVVQQWWFEKKRLAKPILIAAAVAVAVIWLLIELFRALNGGLA
jgi:hypothetical protein